MLWEVEIASTLHDPEKDRVSQEFDLLTRDRGSTAWIERTTRGYLLEGNLQEEDARRLLEELLLDPLAETGRFGSLNAFTTLDSASGQPLHLLATVLLKPGVMDPVAQSVEQAAHDLDLALDSVRTFRRYYAGQPLADASREVFRKVLANDAIEQIVEGPLHLDHLALSSTYVFKLTHIALRDLDDAGLIKRSKDGQLSLNLTEMKAIQAHFLNLGREPTDVELETLAQTWSEHCSHKTLKGRVDFEGRRYQNLLGDTIFAATQEIRKRLGPDDWCVSVFEDNAGIIRFNDQFNVCFKVETHNHPSAIEPYGGANTGLGGVIRDPLGTGLGARPICNTDVFCFAPVAEEEWEKGRRGEREHALDGTSSSPSPRLPVSPSPRLPVSPSSLLPPGVLHPRKIMNGVVAGVRDYGNRMGIPTVNGAVCFDPRYLGNPLVFCGTVGLIPVEKCHKKVEPGDLIVAVGGRTGRDGIHGATFSSIELTSESEKISGGAVQIGNAITEKKMLDVILQARDQGLYNAITDCGAGGFSSAVGEMGEHLGARVQLDQAPLKYQGLSYTEIWISEAQERMILAVSSANWPAFQKLCAGEDVEASVIGTFEPTGKLMLQYHDQQVAELDMDFLHHGCPKREARGERKEGEERKGEGEKGDPRSFLEILQAILSSWNVCSKESIIRQYDHEVQGGSVVKPLVGIRNDGPGDAAVVMPVLGSWAGLAIGCGINPHYGDVDAYAMATLAIDEAVRNVVAVGADPSRIALLDNFCWGNTDRPEVLGSLVRAAEACRDVALAYMTPFISGKDSLNNEFHAPGQHIVIPPTLLISALGRVNDVRRCVTMDLKEPGNAIILLGRTRAELAGSHYHLVLNRTGGKVPQVDLELAPRIFRKLHEAMERGLIRSCHDLSEGGLAVAIAEMAFAGGLGADITKSDDMLTDEAMLFSESPSRFLLEVKPAAIKALSDIFGTDVPWQEIGRTCKDQRLRIVGRSGEWIVWTALQELKDAWQRPLSV